jgi:hypothetical protein
MGRLHAASDYLSHKFYWLVPTGHCLLEGVVKTFVLHVCRDSNTTCNTAEAEATKAKGKAQSVPVQPVIVPLDQLTSEARAAIAKASTECIIVTSEFGRCYRCVLSSG